MPKGTCRNATASRNKALFNSYVSKTLYRYAISQGIKRGVAGKVFKAYKDKFGSFPDGVHLTFDEFIKSHNVSIPVYEPIIITFPDPVNDYWGISTY